MISSLPEIVRKDDNISRRVKCCKARQKVLVDKVATLVKKQEENIRNGEIFTIISISQEMAEAAHLTISRFSTESLLVNHSSRLYRRDLTMLSLTGSLIFLCSLGDSPLLKLQCLCDPLSDRVATCQSLVKLSSFLSPFRRSEQRRIDSAKKIARVSIHFEFALIALNATELRDSGYYFHCKSAKSRMSGFHV